MYRLNSQLMYGALMKQIAWDHYLDLLVLFAVYWVVCSLQLKGRT
jgi:hypothetical protein